MNSPRPKRYAVVNALLVTLIVTLYILTSSPAAMTTMNTLGNGIVYRGHDAGNKIALECAVSWDAASLPAMLDMLEERGVRITFFVSGDFARRNPLLLGRMANDGHEIGTLGDDPQSRLGLKDLTASIQKSCEAIFEACGTAPRLYMPLSQSETIAPRAARELSLLAVQCSVDTLGGKGIGKDIAQRALKDPFGGELILISPTRETVSVLGSIIDGLERRGFEIRTTGEVIGISPV